jgi:hypothetical protein
MAETYNVFISWSGDRSKGAAEALREWLPTVLQAAKPWMSDTDIDKGSRGLDEIGRALEGIKIGIICLSPENLNKDWILYEAGALSKTLDAKTRVCTYLLGDLEPKHVKPPLGLFQATRADKEGTRKLLQTINKALDAPSVPENRLKALFDKMWPDLEDELSALPKSAGTAPPRRSTDEMVEEVLELSRGMASEIRELGLDAAVDRPSKRLTAAYMNNPSWDKYNQWVTMPLSGGQYKLSDLARLTPPLSGTVMINTPNTTGAPPEPPITRLATPSSTPMQKAAPEPKHHRAHAPRPRKKTPQS